MLKIKQWYINLLEKKERGFGEAVFFAVLSLLSLIYGLFAGIRNTLYDFKIIGTFSSGKKIISIGNISWAGSGKTTLALYLAGRFRERFRAAVLRRGYGDDENKLISEKGYPVFFAKDRVGLVKKLSPDFDVFILDDGFQYRRLCRGCDIVVMAARELKGRRWLIPAGIFREPIESLKRASILVINYADELDNLALIKSELAGRFRRLKIFCANYSVKRFSDLEGNAAGIDYFAGKKVAAFAAIGYPAGFFRKLEEAGLTPSRAISYPDHYVLSRAAYGRLEEELLGQGINDLIITHKDKYHFPSCQKKIKIFIMEVEMKIDDEEGFAGEVERCLS